MADVNANANAITVESAPIGIPKDKAGRAEWYAKMRERMGKSRFKVEKVPAGYTAYWARKNDEEELSRMDVLGFRVVRDDPAKPRYKANGLKADGTYVMGDVILMEIPTDEYEFYKEENHSRATALVNGVPESFMNEALKQGAPAFAVDENHRKIK
jgi:hypothetical protein